MLVLPQCELVQCFTVALISALLITWLELRPLGILFILLLCIFLYRTQCNFCLAIPPEFQQKCDNFLQRLNSVRQQRPKMFCAMSSCCLGALAVLGHLISGTSLMFIGLVLAAVISVNYNFKLIKIERKDYDWSNQLTADNDNDEFLPEENETNMFVLERACDLQTLSLPADDADEEERSDDLPSELMLPDNSLAEIDDNSSNNDEVEDLLPLMPAKEQKTDIIEFKRGHFKRDSSISTTSSSSEESLSKGLQFPDLSAIDGAQKSRAIEYASIDDENSAIKSLSQTSLFEKGAKLIPSLVSGLVQWSQAGGVLESVEPNVLTSSSSTSAVVDTHLAALSKYTTSFADKTSQRRVVTAAALDSSDESDFEILQEEDFVQ